MYELSKRTLDVGLALVAAILTFPLLLIAATAVWAQDHSNPFYVSHRIGRHGVPFRFIKVRTMRVDAASSRVDTTVANDPRLLQRVTWIRASKLDELPQFWHVLAGSMTLVGPRPNVPRETALYSSEENILLQFKPGITDISSIVFSDLAQIVAGAPDANIAYNQLVRPWKSRLGLFYVRQRSLALDLQLLFYTFTNAFARDWTLTRLADIVKSAGGSQQLCELVRRRAALTPSAPPGLADIVNSRSLTPRD